MQDTNYPDSHLDLGLGAASVNYSTTAYRTGSQILFYTDYYWFLGAALLELVCIVPVALTYWGWWRFG